MHHLRVTNLPSLGLQRPVVERQAFIDRAPRHPDPSNCMARTYKGSLPNTRYHSKPEFRRMHLYYASVATKQSSVYKQARVTHSIFPHVDGL